MIWIITTERGEIMGDIYFTEKNAYGAWVIYGAIGVRQYYFYTKKQAMKRYREECKQTLIRERK